MQAKKLSRWQSFTTAQPRQNSAVWPESRGCEVHVNLRRSSILGKQGNLRQAYLSLGLHTWGGSLLSPENLAPTTSTFPKNNTNMTLLKTTSSLSACSIDVVKRQSFSILKPTRVGHEWDTREFPE